MGSLRVKFAWLAASAGFVVAVAASGLFWGLRAADSAIEQNLAAQGRLEMLAELSGRLTQYGLAAVDLAGAAEPQPDRLASARRQVEAALTQVAARLGRASGANPDLLGRTELADRSRITARLQASLDLLDRQIDASLRDADAPHRADAVRGAFNAFAAMTGPSLSFLVDAERRGIAAASAEARMLSDRLRAASLAAALVAFAVLWGVFRGLTRPILVRIEAIRAAAGTIGRGAMPGRLEVKAHDELGLLVASFNRMAARLGRRERRVTADRAALEEVIAARTRDLRAANERLAAADQARRRFFADVSHEFRTPLTVILGECDLAARTPPTGMEAIRSVVGTIRGRAQRLHRRVEDLLRVARSEGGEIELDLQPVSALAVLGEAVAACASEAARRRVALELTPPPHDIEIPADREWLRQVVEGLIDNALRHARGATRIGIGLDESRLGATITVADDGPGFPAGEDLLLQRFARAGGQGGGFGIGLALAAWVVGRHGGTLHLGATGTGGARVTLELPA